MPLLSPRYAFISHLLKVDTSLPMLGCMKTGAFILFTADKINCKESVFYLSLQNTSKAGASLKKHCSLMIIRIVISIAFKSLYFGVI